MSISFNTVPTDIKASNLFIETRRAIGQIGATFFIPQIISVVGQYDTAKTVTDYTPRKLDSADEAGSLYGFGSMLHLEAIKVFDAIRTAPISVYAQPVPEDGAASAATGTITVSGPATSNGALFLYIANKLVKVGVSSGDSADDIAAAINTAIGAELEVPVTSTVLTNVVTLTSKWKGLTANDITVTVNLEGTVESSQNPAGVSLAIVDLAGGTVNPDTADVFTAMGDTWFTNVVYPFSDSTSLDTMEAAGDVRAASDVRRFFKAFVGSVELKTAYQAQGAARNKKWTTFISAHGSASLPFEVAAATVGAASVRWQADPARSCRGLELVGIRPGFDIDPYTYVDKDEMEKSGCSTTYIDAFGVVRILDLNTTLKTNEFGALEPYWATRTVAVSNNQAKVYSLEQLLLSEPFVAAKIVSDDAVTSQEYAVSPKRLKGFIVSLIDNLWVPQAWTKNRDAVVDSIVTEIDGLNPERLNAELTDDHAVALRILAVLYRYTATSNF